MNTGGGSGEVRLPAGGVPGKGAQDREMERLRRIEANYERDKAMLEREKTPALARSDSHEVGHVEGEAQNKLSGHEERRLSNDFIEMVKGSSQR
jgi:hypothetical protein